MGEMTMYFTKAGRAGRDDLVLRSPELRCLTEKAVAVFGTGCLGAPSALEFARAGVADLRLLDPDRVDPGTIGRWPLGMNIVGLPKVDVLAEFVKRNYPGTTVRPVVHRIGATRFGAEGERSDLDVMEEMTAGVSLIYDATAEIGVQQYLAMTAAELGIPYVSVAGTYGGWGGKVVCIRPEETAGCWMCCRCALDDGTIAEPPSDPDGQVQARGCGDVTFTGAGFDMAQVAMTGVRTAVATLCEGADGGYPAMDWDVTTITLRDESGGVMVPKYDQYSLAKHPECPLCSAT
jgi:molybdopterin/thiamine biosynthesis adenylyltransferase